MYDILDVIKNIQGLYENNSNLAVLKDFERVLDELDLYVYENWEDGELAYGPIVDRHWITAAFMWPKSKMPDPTGAERLLDIGCQVSYERSYIIRAKPIKTPDDFRPGTKKGQLEKSPIWIVRIKMPKEVAFDMYKGYMDKMKGDLENLKIAPKETAAPAVPAQLPPGMMPGMSSAPSGMPPTSPGMSPAPSGMPPTQPTV